MVPSYATTIFTLIFLNPVLSNFLFSDDLYAAAGGHRPATVASATALVQQSQAQEMQSISHRLCGLFPDSAAVSSLFVPLRHCSSGLPWKTSADSLKKSADALNDSSLWEKKKIKKKDEKTGEEIEVEDYDWDKITKAVKSFVEDYNDVVKEAGESNTKDVLRNASWMTGMTDKNSNMLAKIGITIGKGNKLELDEDALKQADISSLKTVFTGYNSFVSKISQKATGISNAANRASATYTNNGTYSKTDSSLTSSKIDKEV